MLLALPVLAQLTGIGPVDPAAENRALAAAPAIPHSLGQALGFPAALDSYLQDWFGLRQPLVHANDWLRFHLFGEMASPDLLVGKHGRVFMSSHPGGQPLSLIYEVCGAGIPAIKFESSLVYLESMLERAGADAPDPTFVIVPTAATLYAEDLPRWVRTPCREVRPSVDRMLDRFASKPDVLKHIVYPIQFLSALKPSTDIIPKRNFHWFGDGPLKFAEFLSETRFGLHRTLTMPTKLGDWPSDLNRLNPGLDWIVHAPAPDLGMTGASFCSGAACAADADARVVAPLDRYSRPQPSGPRLLIVADSFGDNIAGDFIEYFGEVWHIHFNGLAQMTPAELQKLRDLAFRQFHPDRVVFLCHDFGIFYVPALIERGFWPDNP